MKNFFIVVLCLNLIGCAEMATKPFVEPQYGMTKAQMMDLLGKPEAVEIYKKSDETRVEFYFYVRKYQSFQSKVPVCLINNRIVGWGKTYYEDHVSQDDVRIK